MPTWLEYPLQLHSKNNGHIQTPQMLCIRPSKGRKSLSCPDSICMGSHYCLLPHSAGSSILDGQARQLARECREQLFRSPANLVSFVSFERRTRLRDHTLLKPSH